MKRNVHSERDQYLKQSSKIVTSGKFNPNTARTQKFEKIQQQQLNTSKESQSSAENFFSFTSIVDRVNNLRKGKNVFRNAIDKVKGRKYKEPEEKTESPQRCRRIE